MSLYDKIKRLSRKTLVNEVNQHARDNKEQHDVAVKLGSLGVSPEYMDKYNESIKKIKEYEDGL